MDGRELLTLKVHTTVVGAVAISPDGRRIVTGIDNGTAKVWDAENGRELLTIDGSDARLFSSVVFSPDGQRIVTANLDWTAKVWMAASPEDVEAWRKEEEAAEQRDLHMRAIRTAEAELNAAVTRMDWGEVAAKLAEAEKLIPEDERGELEPLRFKILFGRKDYPAACQLAEKISDAHADDAELQNDLAWTIATGETIEPRALSLAEKIATRANDAAKGRDAQILDTLARVLFMRGKKEAAIQLQEQAVTLAEGEEKAVLQKTLDSYRKGELPKPD